MKICAVKEYLVCFRKVSWRRSCLLVIPGANVLFPGREDHVHPLLRSRACVETGGVWKVV